MPQEQALVSAPLGVDKDSSSPVVLVGWVGLAVTTANRGCESVEQTPSVFVVRNDVGVLEVLLDGASRLPVPAGPAAGCSALPQVAEQGFVRLGPASALHLDLVTCGWNPDNDKVAEAVANARERVLALETSWLASSQEVPQSTR